MIYTDIQISFKFNTANIAEANYRPGFFKKKGTITKEVICKKLVEAGLIEPMKNDSRRYFIRNMPTQEQVELAVLGPELRDKMIESVRPRTQEDGKKEMKKLAKQISVIYVVLMSMYLIKVNFFR